MYYKITLKDEVENFKLETMKKHHSEIIEGIFELYDELAITGACESYSKPHIYYVAYTLADDRIDFAIKEVE